MTLKQAIKQYAYLVCEMNYLDREIDRMARQGLDRQPGTDGEGGYSDSYLERRQRRSEMEELTRSVRAYVYSIPDSLLRQVLLMKYLDPDEPHTWSEVAARFGGLKSQRSLEKMAERHLKKLEDRSAFDAAGVDMPLKDKVG